MLVNHTLERERDFISIALFVSHVHVTNWYLSNQVQEVDVLEHGTQYSHYSNKVKDDGQVSIDTMHMTFV